MAGKGLMKWLMLLAFTQQNINSAIYPVDKLEQIHWNSYNLLSQLNYIWFFSHLMLSLDTAISFKWLKDTFTNIIYP